jgi:ribose transport system permease protein
MSAELQLDPTRGPSLAKGADRKIRSRPSPAILARRVARYGLIMALFAAIICFGLLRPNAFLSVANAQSILTLSAPLVVAALGLTVLLAMNEIDLSIGSMIGLCGATAIAAMAFWSIPWPVAICLALVVAVLTSFCTGWMVARAGANSLIISLGMATLLTGLEFTLTNQRTLYEGVQDGYVALGQSQFLGINIQVLIAAAIAFATHLLLERSEAGRYMYAVGDNPDAAFLAGVPVRRLRVIGFILCGLGAALAGILLTAQSASSFSNAGQSYLLPAFASAFLGSTLSSEGRFTVLGTVTAVLFIAVVQTGLTMLQLSTGTINIVQGGLLIGAVLLSRVGLAGGR